MEVDKRIDRRQMLAAIVEIISLRSTCTRKQVGALIARDARILSIGYVGSPPGQPHCIDEGCIIGSDGGCIRTVHAEANAIAYAARNGIVTQDSDLWTTVAPCLACAKLIISAGIKCVYSLERYRSQDGLALLNRSGVTMLLRQSDQEWSVVDNYVL